MNKVIIAGAGPTGLMLANQLASCGIRVRIIEKKTERSVHSKALAVHARTLETLDILGIAERFVKNGIRVDQMNIFPNGHEKISVHLNTLKDKTPFPFVLVLPQGETERILEEALNEQTIFVERETEILACQEENDGVLVKLKNRQGTDTVKASYLIGCDGAHSTVRKTLNLDFAGGGENVHAMIADLPRELHPAADGSLYISSDGVCLLLPVDHSIMRVIAIDKHRQNFDQKPITLQDVQSALDRISTRTIPLKNPVWLTHFSLSHRQVQSYVHSHIILAGDAAHIHNPIGGQGMNTGIQDAANLGWKLAAVLNGDASPSLLDTYQDERRPIARSIIKQTNFLIHALMIQKPLIIKLREAVMKRILPHRFIQKKGAEKISEIHLHYRDSSVCKSLYNKELPRKALQAGDRMPDAKLKGMNGDVHIYEVLAPSHFTVLISVPADRLDYARKLAAGLPSLAAVFFISEDGSPFQTDQLVDSLKQFQKGTGALSESVIGIRPDGYIAFHHHTLDAGKIESLLSVWLG
ncbi:FAD-dependent monooxygenase [Heyndrickxia acidicola]|uniref:FAD-dependent monooxygenase n=1 Tax=Heyndrickxia acidicola TaxID=209389 RepID=A0ABU6MB13_9BACI|nr:FAD-dependent monooxygenase [Heyndrickxia acidicola]MED1201863.1 FAD-dependent monooxygenase [Heyndrickxia acidicola]